MNWLALSAWIYEDSVPDYGKLAAHAIAVVYVDPRSGNADQVIADIRAHGLLAGAYMATSWNTGLSGAEFAHWCSDTLNARLPKGNFAEAPPFMSDLEAVSVQWQRDFLAEYRHPQPRRPSSYTNAPFQNETVVPIAELQAAGFPWYQQ